ncbi:MAG: DbpA RNA binding domain-containing protein, partial [Anaerolineales bacterium]
VGMVRLSLGRGRKHGVNPGEVVGTIASRADIPGYVIGKILIRDQHTLIDVPEEYVSRVLGQTGAYNFREYQNVTIERA